ncbi:MAG: prolyl oligopeptidase family serine peptidase [bacterium]|nr:prolyl oligopeptidase family serine peptidase [bacterium]
MRVVVSPAAAAAVVPFLSVGLALCCAGEVHAQSGWREPPEIIRKVVEAPPAPGVALSPQRSWLVLTEREAMPRLEVVARPHLKLAGMRIDPRTRGRQLSTRTMAITLRSLADGSEHRVDVPPGHWSGPIWTADDRAFALLHTTDDGIELWLAESATSKPARVDGLTLNAVLGSAVTWLPDQRRLLVRRAIAAGMPPPPRIPDGPQLQETKSGVRAQVRTYQDLLQDAHDEDLFEHFTTCQLAVVDAATKQVTNVGEPAMVSSVSAAPDGSLLLVTKIHRPFSFIVPSSRFPRSTSLMDFDGNVRRVLHSSPLREATPIGGVATGPRGISWVPTLPHTLVWTEALDGGDPKAKVDNRDRVMMLSGVDAEPRRWFDSAYRSWGLSYTDSGDMALATSTNRKTRMQRVMVYDPRDPDKPGSLLYERSRRDAYGDPGRPVTRRSAIGRRVLRTKNGQMYLAGAGATPRGNRPFVDRCDPKTGDKQRLFRCAEGRYESFVGFLDDAEQRLLVRTESSTEPPRLVTVDASTGKREDFLTFEDRAAEHVRGITKRLIHFEREDGVPLSGTLYLPPGYEEGQKLPALVWAYPLEYVRKSDAGQVRATPTRFPRISGSSHLSLLLHGYAVFDRVGMPIVGPVRGANDTFVDQLRMNARAAIAALSQTGQVDTDRVALGGHSYGAFMTANLMAHSDLFAAGIARSGAYNRTLTPFGFQNEERTFWEAPEIYFAMSPFMHAQKIDEPLLLIHGADDNNSGTFPIQSKRLFAAIKGHGGTARLCFLPHESHGYRARESVLHCLAEMCDWMDRHVRNKPADAAGKKR